MRLSKKEYKVLSLSERDILEDLRADEEFLKSRDRFLGKGIVYEEPIELDSKQKEYYEELNKRHNERLKKLNNHYE